MVSYYFKDNEKKLLAKDKREDICNDINNKLTTWYQDLSKPREEAIKLMRDIFPGYDNNVYKIKKVPSTYEQFKTYESAIYRATYQNYDSIVDIEGQDLRSNNISSIYKASLVYDYNAINLKATLDEILFDWTIKGEGAGFVFWEEEIHQVPTTMVVETIDETTGLVSEEIQTTTQDIVAYAGVQIKRIDPHNLYYDKTQYENWQACGKIYRDFVPIQNILANTDYNLTAQEKKELKELVTANKDENISNISSEKVSSDTKVIGSSVEVLEYYGDYIMPDTFDTIRNAEIVIIAGKYIAKIEKSITFITNFAKIIQIIKYYSPLV